jgi:hypothetical protein
LPVESARIAEKAQIHVRLRFMGLVSGGIGTVRVPIFGVAGTDSD